MKAKVKAKVKEQQKIMKAKAKEEEKKMKAKAKEKEREIRIMKRIFCIRD